MPGRPDPSVAPFTCLLVTSPLHRFLQRSRALCLWVLVGVLPMQGLAQLVSALQGPPRHAHAGAAPAVPSRGALAAWLDRLHQAQPAALRAPDWSVWSPVRQAATAWHAHGALTHRHTLAQDDVVPLGDDSDDRRASGFTAFLAWLPMAPGLPVADGSRPRVAPAAAWRPRVVPPPLAPPRG